jgi:redox-sensitive bicupin YhaK (pirin superfamily)
MISVFPSVSRGHVDFGWLDTRHTFSFGNWYNPDRMGFHALRVINEDLIEADNGFGKHFHDDMEILTYVYEGELTHQDNTGGGGVIRRGDVQRMSAGRGIIHSEFNKSKSAECKLLQIWIIPNEFGIVPEYDQTQFSDEAKRGALCLIASGDGRDGSLRMHQDANVYASILPADGGVELPLAPGRHVWVQVVRGHLEINETPLLAGDGAEIEGESVLDFVASEESEFLVFDLP